MKFLTPHIPSNEANGRKDPQGNCLLKSLEENGEISGYASVFRVIDGYGDSVEKGAFANAIREFKNGKKPKLLWQHDGNFPIGVITDIHEDDYGLFIKARLLFEIPKAKEVYALLKNKALDGFSIGYKIKDEYFDNNVHHLTNIELLEVSIVTFPACEKAVVSDIKANCVPAEDNMQKYLELIKNISQKINHATKGKIS
ncbi:MAG: HK97 family phage prohead protease [Holosporaceae bacterium]|nr:HK97 family phage prohead protease [Holosporaceae bacterium]